MNDKIMKQVSENEDSAIKLLKENVELKEIINKAREYIVNQKLHKFEDTTGGLTYNERKLLEILGGEK